MCLVRPPGCRLCGAYAVVLGAIAHELVVGRSTGLLYSAAQMSMRICMREVPLWGIEFRVQDAGAMRVSNAEGIRRMVRKHAA